VTLKTTPLSKGTSNFRLTFEPVLRNGARAFTVFPMSQFDVACEAIRAVVENSWIEGETKGSIPEGRVRFDPLKMGRAQKLRNRSPDWLTRMVDAADAVFTDLLLGWSASMPNDIREERERHIMISYALKEKLSGAQPSRPWRDNGDGGFEPIAG
jgi:hypothetical protein